MRAFLYGLPVLNTFTHLGPDNKNSKRTQRDYTSVFSSYFD